jgi:outer membrane biosynthesis protein TonB
MTVGETRRFAVHAFDTPRRGIDLVLVLERRPDRRAPHAEAVAADEEEVADIAPAGDVLDEHVEEQVDETTPEQAKDADADVGTATTDTHANIAQEAPVTPVKKATKKAATKRTTKRAVAKKATKKAPAKKAAAKKAIKKSPAKKAGAKKATKKAPAKKATAKKVAKKATAKKATTKAPAKKATKKAAAKRTTARR